MLNINEVKNELNLKTKYINDLIDIGGGSLLCFVALGYLNHRGAACMPYTYKHRHDIAKRCRAQIRENVKGAEIMEKLRREAR